MLYSDDRALLTPAQNAAYQQTLAICADGLERIRTWYAEASLPLLHLPEARADLTEAADFAAQVRTEFDDFIVLGTGGSNLGAKTLFALQHKGLPQVSQGIRCHFLDNVDPTTFQALMGTLDPERTFLFSVSKSGATAETLSQTVLLIDWLQTAGCDLAQHLAVLTEPKPSPLTAISERFGCRAFAHDPLLGGRFSVFSLVGLIPALVAGINGVQLREGAWSVLKPVLEGAVPEETFSARGAALAVVQAAEGRNQTVLLPYADQLADLGLWYRQLWAESLGKEGKGTTPIRALGTVDQHSQLQLYLDGPPDKLFTFIEVAQQGVLPALKDDLLDGNLAYLRGKSLGDLLVAECRATADALAARGQPVRVIQIEQLCAFTLGQIMMHFMLETILTAQIWGIDAFNQPAVEAIKIRTRNVLAGQ